MKNSILSALLCGIAILFLTSPLHAQELSLSECQSIKDDISRYDRLRKKGGSARQMEKWKQSRQELKSRFSKFHCKKYGKKLK